MVTQYRIDTRAWSALDESYSAAFRLYYNHYNNNFLFEIVLHSVLSSIRLNILFCMYSSVYSILTPRLPDASLPFSLRRPNRCSENCAPSTPLPPPVDEINCEKLNGIVSNQPPMKRKPKEQSVIRSEYIKRFNLHANLARIEIPGIRC